MGNGQLADTAPLYQKLKNHLKTQIELGNLRPGEKIYTEYQLIEKFGISRTTARNALSELEREGLVCREQGRGTFVRFSPVVTGSAELKSFTEEMIERGHKPGSIIINLKLIPTSDKVRKNLKRVLDESIIFFRAGADGGRRANNAGKNPYSRQPLP